MTANILTKTVEQSVIDAQIEGVVFVNHWSVIDLYQEAVSMRFEIKQRTKTDTLFLCGCKYYCSIEISTSNVQAIEVALGDTLIDAFNNAILETANAVDEIDFFVYKLPSPNEEANLTCYELYNAVSTAIEEIAQKSLGIKKCLVAKARNY
jgi:hypothetical protein